jgi:hypothetical protein
MLILYVLAFYVQQQTMAAAAVQFVRDVFLGCAAVPVSWGKGFV